VIEKDELKDLILRRFSKKKIAIYYGVSTSTVGKYLSRYNIKIGRKKKNVPNGKICILCENELTDRQKRFCSKRCCISFLYKNEYSTSTNSQKHRGFEKKKILIDTLGGKCEKCGYNKNMAGWYVIFWWIVWGNICNLYIVKKKKNIEKRFDVIGGFICLFCFVWVDAWSGRLCNDS